jgi:hypothetical protein
MELDIPTLTPNPPTSMQLEWGLGKSLQEISEEREYTPLDDQPLPKGHLNYFDKTEEEKEENRIVDEARRQEDREEWEHEEEILRAALPNIPAREKDIL